MSLPPLLWKLRQRIFPGDDGEEGGLGALALSADGTTLALAVGGGEVGVSGQTVRFYKRVGGAWVYQDAISVLSTDAVLSDHLNFGAALALSADGNTVIIGASSNGRTDAMGDTEPINYIGGAWVFTREDDVWFQLGLSLAPNDEAPALDDEPLPSGDGDETRHVGFGASVALSADGRSTAVVGGPGEAPYHENKPVGAAWVFVFDDDLDDWVQQGPKLMPVDPEGWEIGGGPYHINAGWVAVRADGERIFILTVVNTLTLAPGDPVGPVGIYEYRRDGDAWVPHSEIVEIGEFERFGQFAVSADGNTVVNGGSPSPAGYAEGPPDEHRIHVWHRDPEWTDTLLVPTEQIDGDVVSYWVDIIPDGTQIAIGSRSDHEFEGLEDGPAEGAAWVFARESTGEWTQISQKIFPRIEDGDAEQFNYFGRAVVLTRNLLVGAAEGQSEEPSIYSYEPGLAVSLDGIKSPSG